MRTEFVCRCCWPALGCKQPGRIVDGLVNTVDIFPTVLELAGIDPSTVIPATRRIDGVSMVPYMRMPGRASRRQYIYAERFTDRFDHGYQRAIRNAEYKLIDRRTAIASSTI